MENVLLDTLKINDLKLVGTSAAAQKQDTKGDFEAILQGLLGSGKSTALASQPASTKTGTPANLSGFRDNLNSLAEILEKISDLLDTNEGEPDIEALEKMMGRNLTEDEISLCQLIAGKDFSLEELQAMLLDEKSPEAQTPGLTIDSETDEPVSLKIKELIGRLDDIIKEINLSLENSLKNTQDLTAEKLKNQENIKSMLAVFESLKGNLQHINNKIETAFTTSDNPVFEGYDNIDQVKKTFWATIEQLMGNKTDKGNDNAASNLLSSEIVSNEDLRDLRKNIENLLQNRQSLQKLFNSDSAVDRKFVSAVLNYADALKENNGRTGLTTLAKNLASLNTETAKSPVVTIDNTLYKELLSRNEGLTDESVKTDQPLKTSGILKTGLTENNSKEFTPNQNNQTPNNPFSFTDVQVLKSESGGTTPITSETVNQSSILNQISQKINMTLNKAQSSVTIQLDPPSLGKVDVNLTLKNNHLQAVMIAESAQIKHILESNLHHLKISLEGHNIEVDKVSVFVGNEENNFSSFLKEQRNSNSAKNSLKSLNDNIVQTVSNTQPKVVITDKSENLDLFI